MQDERSRALAKQAWGFLKSRIGERLTGASFETYECYGSEFDQRLQRQCVAELRAYAKDIDGAVASGNGLLLYGRVGTGKDHLAYSVGKEAAQAGFVVKWLNGESFYSEFRACGPDRNHEYEVVGEFVQPQILWLSDPLPDAGVQLTDWQRRCLYRVVDDRYRDKRPTIVTVNASSKDDLFTRLGHQIADRLWGSSVVVHMNWPSHRSFEG